MSTDFLTIVTMAKRAICVFVCVASPVAQAADLSEERYQHWHYYKQDDPMGGKNYTAEIFSRNTVSFDFPYHGEQHGILSLNTHSRYGKRAALSLEKGQFLCSSYDGCRVQVRFDGEKAATYSASGPADYSNETIFIDNYDRFLSSLLKASTLRISASVYHEGSPVFEFNVAGFDREAYFPASERSGQRRKRQNLLEACLNKAHDDFASSRANLCQAGGSIKKGACSLSREASELLEKYYSRDKEFCNTEFNN